MTENKVDEYKKTYVEAFKPKLRKLHADWNATEIEEQAQKDARIPIKDMRNLESAKAELSKV